MYERKYNSPFLCHVVLTKPSVNGWWLLILDNGRFSVSIPLVQLSTLVGNTLANISRNTVFTRCLYNP